MKLPWNWRNNIEIVKEINFEIIYTLQFKNNLIPSEFDQKIGSICIKIEENHFVENSHIVPHMRNRQLGRMLYEHALIDLGTISTTYHEASEDARRVWHSLMRDYKYKTDFWKLRLILTAR